MSRVLVVGDLHLPADHPSYFEFIKDVKRKYKTNETVFIGDIVDHHAISFHKQHPEADSAMSEYKSITESIKKWKRLFKNATVCIGNHDERVHRLNADAGIPSVYLKEYNEVWNTPTWDWKHCHEIDGVMYTHGTGTSGLAPAFNTARVTGNSWVMGHCHSVASVSWLKAPNGNLIFGMNVGCGIDPTHVVMDYGKNHIKKPIVAAGVVIDGHPYLEIM
jgi:predicted phosphodiesterase|tara:strand:- start:506 stop:1162 length:657 start_codon:yes stop_codon:yes gene_type:complete